MPHLNGNPTPARCNRKTGEIWINDQVWRTISPEHRVFILLHEYGHIMLDSSDELAVDEYAMKLYISLGYSLTDSVKSLSRVLTGKSDQHVQRVQNQYNRAKEIDKKNLKSMCNNTAIPCSCTNAANNNFTGEPNAWYNNDVEDFGGCDASKLRPRQYRKCVKVEGKAQAKVNKSEGTKALKEGRGAGLAAKGNAKQLLAEQGIVDESGAGGVIKSGLAMLKGGGDAPEAKLKDDTKEKKSPWIWVAVGTGVLLIVGVVIFLIKRK